MRLSIEIITECGKPDSIQVEVGENQVGALAQLGAEIVSIFKAYDPIALHIIQPSKWEVKADGKEKE